MKIQLEKGHKKLQNAKPRQEERKKRDLVMLHQNHIMINIELTCSIVVSFHMI